MVTPRHPENSVLEFYVGMMLGNGEDRIKPLPTSTSGSNLDFSSSVATLQGKLRALLGYGIEEPTDELHAFIKSTATGLWLMTSATALLSWLREISIFSKNKLCLCELKFIAFPSNAPPFSSEIYLERSHYV